MAITKRSVGRPSKLTSETEKLILTFVSAGVPIHVACAAAGINKDTYFHWLKQADAKGGKYAEFRAAIDQANAKSVVKNVGIISRAAMQGVWQAAAWWLERRFPDEWAKTERHELTGANGGPVQTLNAADARARMMARIEELSKRARDGSPSAVPAQETGEGETSSDDK